jgi:hypothetical protein
MSLKVENIEQLKQLLEGVEFDFSQLQELLVELQGKDPTEEREAIAHQERMRALEHTERLRSLELGHAPADSAEVARTRSAVRAASAIGIVVPVVLACAATAVSVVILRFLNASVEIRFFDVRSDLQATLFAITWGICGLVMLFTVFSSLLIVWRAREWSPAPPQPAPARPVPHEDGASARSTK